MSEETTHVKLALNQQRERESDIFMKSAPPSRKIRTWKGKMQHGQ